MNNYRSSLQEIVDENIRKNLIPLKWRSFYRIPANDQRYLSMTFTEMALDVLTMDKLNDPKALYEILTGGVRINKAEVQEATQEEAQRITEDFKDAMDSSNLTELDAALDSMLSM